MKCTKNIILFLLFLAYGEVCYITSLRTNIFSIVQQEYHLDYSHIATLVLISGIVMQISIYLTGLISKKWSYHKSLIGGLGICGISIFCMFFVKNIFLFDTLFVLFMFGFGVCNLTLNMYAGALAENNRGKALMKLHLGAALGMSIGPTVISQLMHIGFSWQSILGASSFPAFILIFLLFFNKQPNTQQSIQENQSIQTTEHELNSKSFIVWMFIIIFICAQIWEYGVGTWFVIYARAAKDLSEIQAAKYLTIFLAGFPVGRLIYSKILDYVSYYKSILIAFIGNFILILLGIITKELIFISLTGFFTSSMFPVIMSMMQEKLGDHRSDLIGWICMVGGILQYIFIWSVGKLGDIWGIELGFSSLIIYMFIGALTVLFIRNSLSENKSSKCSS
ncbi:MFS transporter [Crassaminicella profunda]|uniref:MFS transporter n=1 Tax=Crassaminicella profunda TaxID=1286698 RepID=UPI001CA788BC|nr:MFS transporter [Crassaminicella profunda]QZY55448.1 MFS transporter [Crassaminicella profunda]